MILKTITSICIPESLIMNIIDYKITFVNSTTREHKSKGDFVLKNRVILLFKPDVLKRVYKQFWSLFV